MTTTVTITITDTTDEHTWADAMSWLAYAGRPSAEDSKLSHALTHYGPTDNDTGLSVHTVIKRSTPLPTGVGAVVQDSKGMLYTRTASTWYRAGSMLVWDNNEIQALLDDGGRVLFEGEQA